MDTGQSPEQHSGGNDGGAESASRPAVDLMHRLGQVNEADANIFEWGSIQGLCSGDLFADAQQTFGYVRILPGQKNPQHYHPNSDEMLLLLEGELHHSLDDQSFHLRPGMSIHIPQGVLHDARNQGEVTAHMIVAYPTNDRRVVMNEEGQE